MADWDARLLSLARFVAGWSRDPSTQVGAVIARPNHSVAGVGYNGLPIGVEDTPERLNTRDLKYKLIVHAERNALVFAGGSVEGCTLYTWPFLPCPVCAGLFLQAGIARVVAPPLPRQLLARWEDDIVLSVAMLREAGVIVATREGEPE